MDSPAELKPFQSLKFLVRNWKFSDYQFGSVGGNKYVAEKLAAQDIKGGNEKNKKARESVTKSFQEISGFLLPYPGRRINEGKFSDQMKESATYGIHRTWILNKDREILQ